MAEYDYDLVTIGGGSGGVRASRMAASYGARVALAESGRLGGTCVNVGCIPKKLLVYASHFAEDFEDARGFGWTVGERSFDWATLIAAKDKEIERLNGVYRRLLETSGVAIFEARATVAGPHEVLIGEQRVSAANILIATGGWPHFPDTPGIELAVSSNEMFHLSTLPERVVIVGGGYIAVEFAGILHGLGSRVVQLYRGPLFLRGFDHDIRLTLAEEMRKKGIELRLNEDVTRLERAGSGVRLTLRSGGTLEADLVLYATGRQPSTRGLGLEEAGVKLRENGAVVVDDESRSSVPSIYAIGDVTDRINLTPVAIHEGAALAATLFGGRPTKMSYADIPSAIFSQPPVGTVGLTEEVARAHCGEIDVYRTRFHPLKHTMTGRDERVMMKLVVDRASGRVVGCHMVGADAGEIVQGLAIALKCHATKAQFDATVGIHPTSAEEFVTLRDRAPDPPGGIV